MDVFPPNFTSLAKAVFPTTPQSRCFFVMGFYNLITVFPDKTSCCKLITKRARSLVVILLRSETKADRARLLPMCRGELSAPITWLISQCLRRGWKC